MKLPKQVKSVKELADNERFCQYPWLSKKAIERCRVVSTGRAAVKARPSQYC